MSQPQGAPKDEESQNDETRRLSDGQPVRWYLNGRKYSQRELTADATVLTLGAVISFPAALALIWHTALVGNEETRFFGIIAYCCGFVLMFNASRLFHQNAGSEERGPIYLFMDKMGINCMIAGSYTPICIQAGCHTCLAIAWGLALFGFIWELALWKRTLGWKGVVDIIRFVAAGWLVLAFIPSVVPYLTTWAAWTILAHGIVFTVGTIFLQSKSMEFHFAIWHSLVFVAAALFYYVVYLELSVGPPLGSALHQSISDWQQQVAGQKSA